MVDVIMAALPTGVRSVLLDADTCVLSSSVTWTAGKIDLEVTAAVATASAVLRRLAARQAC